MLRQIISMLLVTAYLSATIFAPVAYAAPSEMSASMMMKQSGNSEQLPMPCKGMKTGCVTEIGCIFMVGLPAPGLSAGTPLAWSPITYSVSLEFLNGRATKPVLEPPRSFT